jgi:hypothetical protein
MLNEKIAFPDISPENRFAFDENGEFACLDTVYYAVRGNSLPSYDSRYLTAVLNSNLLDYLFDRMSPKVRGGYRRYKTQYVESLPIPAIDFTDRHQDSTDFTDLIETICKDIADGGRTVDEALSQLYSNREKKFVLHDTLCHLADLISGIKKERRNYNLNLLDYLGSYEEGKKLQDFPGYQPSQGVSETILSETTETRDNLRIGDVQVSRKNLKVTIEASARYKPENPDEFETDRWGYTETESYPVMEFVGVNQSQSDLLFEFIGYATDEADGFAGFRETATKRNSLVDRLSEIIIPSLQDVESDLEKYLNQKQSVNDLNNQQDRLFNFLNQIVYELYELEEEKVEMVENTR